MYMRRHMRMISSTHSWCGLKPKQHNTTTKTITSHKTCTRFKKCRDPGCWHQSQLDRGLPHVQLCQCWYPIPILEARDGWTYAVCAAPAGAASPRRGNTSTKSARQPLRVLPPLQIPVEYWFHPILGVARVASVLHTRDPGGAGQYDTDQGLSSSSTTHSKSQTH